MTRILIVDDYPVVVEGVKQILAEAIPRVEFGEAPDGETALRLLRKEDWDIVILDLSLPDRSGLELLKQMKAIKPATPVLALSMYAEEQFAVRLLRSGAAGYVNKKAASQELVAAVQRVLAGGRFMSSDLAERLVHDLRQGAPRAPHESLSDREYLVFRMLASGRTVKDIASELRLSPQTVSTHRTRILEKMAMTTNADLVKYVTDNRLLG
ncbi:MAG: response regulator [Syntrophomonadaceae bacterium]